ncbi:MAG: hypothetical protein A4E65_02222 [Syntrophorhabdus sp. PtaU1.Bin153]|nr:MAG: hypothetical protein A4E65_02222 [Syntrophorhabdus sp. PtaU1.Bin153]
MKTAPSGFFSHPCFPTGLVDLKIDDEVNVIRKSRFFVEFDRVHSGMVLARRLISGELCGGTDPTRSRALAWCSRLLSRTEEFDNAQKFLKLAQELDTGPEIDIANAFICSQKGDKPGALGILAHVDLPISRSAALMIVAYHEGAQETIGWLTDTGTTATDLDADGKYFLMTLYLGSSEWISAFECLDAITDNDLRETPALYHVSAITRLLSTVPAELRSVVLNQVPFNATDFPLASDVDSIRLRRLAKQEFARAAETERTLHCPKAAAIDDEYELWLELMDPEESADGRKRLEAKLRDPKSALCIVYLGLQFGFKLDLETIEREIDRQIALSGGMTRDAALARFALAFTKKTPEEVAKYIERHREELSGHINKQYMQFIEVEMFSKAGLVERANNCLRKLLDEGISKADEGRLRLVVAEAQGTDPVKARKQQFESTDSLGDLASLVEVLETKGEWDDICKYGMMLFERTHALHDAERISRALLTTQKNDKLVSFLKGNQTLVSQSKNLRMLYCWSLFDEGELLEARTVLARLNEDWDNPNYRALKVNLTIGLGDWNSLFEIIANEYREKDKRGAQELVGAAQLALQIGSPYAKELVFAAASKGDNDAAILTNAYFLASGAGWEDDLAVFQWLQKAAELSGADGPIMKISLKDLLDRKPEWDRRESEIWQLLNRGETPMFVAAEALNKSLIDLMLFPALANLSESDPRRRAAIPAYSGRQQPRSFKAGGSVGIDATALITLSFMGLLDRALDAFETVYMPHSTLAWLFHEKQKATFHQPSRIRDAYHLQNLLVRGLLEKFSPKAVPDGDLSAQVGEEIASFVADAERGRKEDGRQYVVVRPSPVYRVTTFMEEEADLTEHSGVLSSCQALIDKLRESGHITGEQARKAGAYLHLQEKPWPNQPNIEEGAILYLDDLAVTYLVHLGLIEKLRPAGFKPIISVRKGSEAKDLISYDSISSKVNEAIEEIRFALNLRIESGRIKIGRRINTNETEPRPMLEHPSVGLMDLSRYCDAIISDDRFFNQHANIDNHGNVTPIFSTLDLVNELDDVGAEDKSEYRTLLRRAGYLFMPVTSEELTSYIKDASVQDGKVVETAELKAIRESLLRVRMSTWLRIPEEATWLDAVIKTFVHVIKTLWTPESDPADVKARCDWMLNQIEIRGWAHALVPENRDHLIRIGRGLFVLMLLTPLSESLRDVKDEYWNWIEDRVLAPIKNQYPDLFSSIVEWQRKQIAELVNRTLSEGEGITNVAYARSVVAQTVLEGLHPLIRAALIENSVFRKEYGFVTDSVILFGGSNVSFRQSLLFNAVRKVYGGAPETKVIDTKRRKWRLSIAREGSDRAQLVLSRGQQRFIPIDFYALSPSMGTRLGSFDEAASDVNLPHRAQDRWKEILAKRALADDEMNAFHDDFLETPIVKARSIRNEVFQGKSELSSLIPSSRRYFERLIGSYDGSATILDYAANRGKALFQELSKWRPYEGFLAFLVLSSHSSMTAQISLDQLNTEDLIRALEFLKKRGDRISQLGAIEVGLSLLPLKPEIEPHLAHLVGLIRDDDATGQNSQFKLLSTLFLLVDGALSRTRILASEPPFYRRLAALAQAALIEREIAGFIVDLGSFHEWAFSQSGWQFYFQSLADMRTEPRWNPEFAAPTQLKEEFLGRIINAANNVKENLHDSSLVGLILGPHSGSLQTLADGLLPFLPGPLEGALESQNILPPEIAETIQTQLRADEVGPRSFIALVNFALIFRMDSDQAEIAAKALRLANHRLAKIEDRTELAAILNGLAMVAAITRSPILANELRILVRKYRHDPQYSLTVLEATKACLMAAASHTELDGWRQFAGDWLTELAFDDLEGYEAELLHSYLKRACHAVPELWASCGRADAALSAYSGNRYHG